MSTTRRIPGYFLTSLIEGMAEAASAMRDANLNIEASSLEYRRQRLLEFVVADAEVEPIADPDLSKDA